MCGMFGQKGHCTISTLPRSVFVRRLRQKVGFGQGKMSIVQNGRDRRMETACKYVKMTAIPRSVFRFNDLTILDLSGNAIEEVPAAIGSLTHLTDLNLAHNRIRRISAVILTLDNLYFVNLIGNVGFDAAVCGWQECKDYLAQQILE